MCPPLRWKPAKKPPDGVSLKPLKGCDISGNRVYMFIYIPGFYRKSTRIFNYELRITKIRNYFVSGQPHQNMEYTLPETQAQVNDNHILRPIPKSCRDDTLRYSAGKVRDFHIMRCITCRKLKHTVNKVSFRAGRDVHHRGCSKTISFILFIFFIL
jgi:hypothetical protein